MNLISHLTEEAQIEAVKIMRENILKQSDQGVTHEHK